MKPSEIQSGKTYVMDSGRKRYVAGINQRYLGMCVNFQNVLKNGALGTQSYCLLSTFAGRAVRKVEE